MSEFAALVANVDAWALCAYLMAENGDPVAEDNTHRTRWPDSPVWSVVNGPWRLKSFTEDAVVTFIPNEHYSGPAKPYLDEFRLVPTDSDDQQYAVLQAGTHGPGSIQVGWLPPALLTSGRARRWPAGSAATPVWPNAPCSWPATARSTFR